MKDEHATTPQTEGREAEWAENVEPNPSAGHLLAFVLVAVALLALVALVRDWPGRTHAEGAADDAWRGGPVCPTEPLAPSLSLIAAQRQRDSERRQKIAAPEGGDDLLDAWRAYNRAEAARDAAADLAPRNRELAARMAAFASQRGYDAYVSLGLRAIDELEARLLALEERARAESTDLPRFVATHPADEQVRAFHEHAGDLLDHARDSALMGTPGDDPVVVARRRFWVRLLAKARWLMWVRDVRPVEAGLSRFEAAQLAIWRAERRQDHRPEAVMATVDELRRLHPKGHWAWRFGCRYLGWGRADLAQRLFLAEAARHPHHGPTRAALALVEGLAASSPRPAAGAK